MKSAIKYTLFLWGLFYIILAYFLSQVGSMDIVLIRVTTFVIPQMVLFYLNLIVLIPFYFEGNRKTAYFISLLFITTVFTFTFGNLDLYFDQTIPLEVKHFEEKPIAFVFFSRFMSAIPPIIIGALIRKSILLQQKTKESLELQNKMLEAETNALKAQINPHFLFNTLNNIYSLSQFDNKKTGEAILQLSDILRYVTYEGDKKLVPLTSEIEHIGSFIKLQKLRDEDDSNISVDIEINTRSLKISPLLLIPFIENCFKHSNHHDKKNGWIKIKIRTAENQLFLETSNSLGDCTYQKDTVGGVGMENVKKRLYLLYPNQHDLVLRMDKVSYSAILKINLET